MASDVHFVGSIGLDSVDEVFQTCGSLLGRHLKRVPDGEPGGRRLWIGWQLPLLRASPYLQPVASERQGEVAFYPLKLATGVRPEDVHFGELGYAREARISYIDFCTARDKGILPRHVRFQVSLPTPLAVVGPFIVPEVHQVVLPAYEQAMLREVVALTAAIPRRDLAIQWDVAIEMIMWDGRFQPIPGFPGMEAVFRDTFQRLAQRVSSEVELGFHLCYGDLDGKHFVQPVDATKMVELANLIAESAKRPIAWMHMPVPVDRSDDPSTHRCAISNCRPAPSSISGLWTTRTASKGRGSGWRRRASTSGRSALPRNAASPARALRSGFGKFSRSIGVPPRRAPSRIRKKSPFW